MNREQFYELLDIESAEDFQYFENLAAFFECEEELDYEDVAALFGAVDQAANSALAGRDIRFSSAQWTEEGLLLQ